MRETVALVEHYLREWNSRGWAKAYHSLVDTGMAGDMGQGFLHDTIGSGLQLWNKAPIQPGVL